MFLDALAAGKNRNGFIRISILHQHFTSTVGLRLSTEIWKNGRYITCRKITLQQSFENAKVVFVSTNKS